jgi:O-acetyl-ADP-ribose deacetylase (regulator of RNase III)
MPALATGVGGLSWSDVKPLIVQHLGDLQIPIYLYSSIRSRYLQPFLLEDLQ